MALNRRRAESAPPPSQTTVTVLNGNGQVGSATSAASQLGARGYKIVTSGDGNAPSWEYFRTEVYYQGGADARAAANKLSKLFGDARLSPIPAEIAPLSNGAAVTVIVGQTYHGTIAAAPADKTPERSAPAVRIDSAATPYLQDGREARPVQADGRRPGSSRALRSARSARSASTGWAGATPCG